MSTVSEQSNLAQLIKDQQTKLARPADNSAAFYSALWPVAYSLADDELVRTAVAMIEPDGRRVIRRLLSQTDTVLEAVLEVSADLAELQIASMRIGSNSQLIDPFAIERRDAAWSRIEPIFKHFKETYCERFEPPVWFEDEVNRCKLLSKIAFMAEMDRRKKEFLKVAVKESQHRADPSPNASQQHMPAASRKLNTKISRDLQWLEEFRQSFPQNKKGDVSAFAKSKGVHRSTMSKALKRAQNELKRRKKPLRRKRESLKSS